MDLELQKIVNNYLKDFENKKNFDFVVKNSIPVVWFGDIEAYQKSPKRIVTIGVNPSNKEFPTKDKPRFDCKANNADALYNTLNNYFKDNDTSNPYTGWFNNLERCLNLIDTSFGGKMNATNFTNTAIHIDEHTSIATSKIWRKLKEKQIQEINQQELFQDLLNYLNPDVILMSRNHDIFMSSLHIVNPVQIFYEHRKIEVYQENNRIMVYGRNSQGTPFSKDYITDKMFNDAFSEVRNLM
ncbi:MAG: hypothetical protein HDT36_00115 [Clostridiales bacterium]|nr:hypothetical protein [Clostridiales bacterium]